tara:strand:+ start:1261 stop:1686 length:426 start_codon:yes stop_codon:yes gene_type:complete
MISRFLAAAIFTLGVATFTQAADPVESDSVVPAGSITAGQTLFVEKGCYQCHYAGEIDLPPSKLNSELFIRLGVKKHTQWDRDDFARSIMNPNHTVSEEYRIVMITLGDKFKAENSPMPSFNDMLTVSELIHLTTFLDSLK